MSLNLTRQLRLYRGNSDVFIFPFSFNFHNLKKDRIMSLKSHILTFFSALASLCKSEL